MYQRNSQLRGMALTKDLCFMKCNQKIYRSLDFSSSRSQIEKTPRGAHRSESETKAKTRKKYVYENKNEKRQENRSACNIRTFTILRVVHWLKCRASCAVLWRRPSFTLTFFCLTVTLIKIQIFFINHLLL